MERPVFFVAQIFTRMNIHSNWCMFAASSLVFDCQGSDIVSALGVPPQIHPPTPSSPVGLLCDLPFSAGWHPDPTISSFQKRINSWQTRWAPSQFISSFTYITPLIFGVISSQEYFRPLIGAPLTSIYKWGSTPHLEGVEGLLLQNGRAMTPYTKSNCPTNLSSKSKPFFWYGHSEKTKKHLYKSERNMSSKFSRNPEIHERWVGQAPKPTVQCSKKADHTHGFKLRSNGQIIIFHQPRFPYITTVPFLVRSCEVAIIWPECLLNEAFRMQHSYLLNWKICCLGMFFSPLALRKKIFVKSDWRTLVSSYKSLHPLKGAPSTFQPPTRCFCPFRR